MDDITTQQLKKCASTLKLLLSDIDGTLIPKKNSQDSNYTAISNLTRKVINANKMIGFISARNTSLRKILLSKMQDTAKKSHQDISFFHSGGNGANLLYFTVTREGKISFNTIYERKLTLRDIHSIINAYISLNIPKEEISFTATTMFMKFLHEDWTGLLSRQHLSFMEKFPGLLFVEPIKVGLAMPDDEKKRIVYGEILKKNLPDHIMVGYGGTPFADVSLKPKSGEDGKLFAAKKLIRHLDLSLDSVAYFGDSPNEGDNDAALLQYIRYGFTNTSKVKKLNSHVSPYVLNADNDPITTVYKSIDILLL